MSHSLRAAINGMCKQCIYDPISGEGNWRQQVGACTSLDCALYAVRPVSKPKGATSGEVASEAEKTAESGCQ